MAIFAELFLELGMVIGTVLLIEFLVLLFRNPHRSKWLRSDFAQTTAALLLVAVSCLVFAMFMTGLLGAGLDVFAALPIAVAIPVVVVFVSMKLVGFRERLRRADAGLSPFQAHLSGADDRATPAG